MISRILIFLYSLACYAAGVAALVYGIGFVGDYLVPKSIDTGPASTMAVIVDLVLLGLFAVQHSGMARQGFKRRWMRIVSPSAERATYVLVSAALLGLLYWQWQPLPGAVWQVMDANAALVLAILYFLGWVIVFLSSFLINHFELFGLQQSFAHLRGNEVPSPRFKTPLLYRLVRHPIYLGLLLAFWATPHMSWGHLLFSLATTGYILIGATLEERDLTGVFGEAYGNYRRAVPMLIPLPRFMRRSRKSGTA